MAYESDWTVFATCGYMFNYITGWNTYYPVKDSDWKACGITDEATKSKYNYCMAITDWRLDKLDVNLNYLVVENDMAQDQDGTISRFAVMMDAVVGHELVHGIMNHCLRWHSFYPGWFIESIAELIWGIDISRKNSLTTLVKDATEMENTFNDNPSSAVYKYVLGVLVFRYLIKNYCK